MLRVKKFYLHFYHGTHSLDSASFIFPLSFSKMKHIPSTWLISFLLLVGCNSIPEPTEINIDAYAPPENVPLAEYSAPLSDQEAWETQGWEEISENGITTWESSSGIAKSLQSHRDLDFHLEMKLSPGSALEIRLQNAYPLTIFAEASQEGHGVISGIAPARHAGRKPGLWQTLNLEFSAPISNESGQFPARIIRASLNGIPIHQNISLPATNTEGYGRLVLQATGNVSIRNVGVNNHDQNDPGNPTTVKPLIPASTVTYDYFEKEGWDRLAVFNELTALSSGTAALIDISGHSQRESDYGLIYTGTFTVPTAGSYVFLLTSDDGSNLTIDNELLIMNDGFHGPETVSDTVTLDAGEHEAVIRFFQGGGGASLRLDYTAPGLGTIPLFSPEEGTVSIDNTTYLLDPESEPIVQRGFLIFPPVQELSRGEAPNRITHGVSVGSPDGNHFAVDAAQGTLLMLWHGKFANMANMWEGRGEWQNLSPLGDLIARSGKPDFAMLSGPKSLWPDSVGESNSILTKGYGLDASGWPTFDYNMGLATIQDGYHTNEEGVVRTVSITGNEAPISHLIASGSSIENLGKGKYAIQGPGYLAQINTCEQCELFLRQTAAGQELVARIAAGGGSIATTFSW